MMIQAVGTPADFAGNGAQPSIPAPVSGPPQKAAPQAALEQSNAELRKALEELAQRLDSGRTQLNFRVDQQLNQVVISIVDPDSGAVLRQIPGEEVLRMAQNLQEYLGGLVDETA